MLCHVFGGGALAGQLLEEEVRKGTEIIGIEGFQTAQTGLAHGGHDVRIMDALPHQGMLVHESGEAGRGFPVLRQEGKAFAKMAKVCEGIGGLHFQPVRRLGPGRHDKVFAQNLTVHIQTQTSRHSLIQKGKGLRVMCPILVRRRKEDVGIHKVSVIDRHPRRFRPVTNNRHSAPSTLSAAGISG